MPAKHWSTDTYAVTRRFGLGLILLATVYAAVLLVALQWIRFGFPFSFYYIAGLIVFVGAAQAALSRLNRPRWVSAAAGAVYLLPWLYVWAAFRRGALPPLDWGWLLFVVSFGSVSGYAAGGVAASLFLLHDALTLRRRLRREAIEEFARFAGRKEKESPFDD